MARRHLTNAFGGAPTFSMLLKTLSRKIGRVRTCVLPTLALVSTTFAGAPAAAQTIVNVANVEWTVGGTQIRQPSNSVAIQVEAPTSPTIELFDFANPGDPGSTNIPASGAQCRAANGSLQALEPRGVFAGTATSPATLVPTSAIRAGQPLVLAIDAPSQNRNATARETFEVTLTTANDDRERIILVETAPNSGRFAGVVETAAIPPNPVQGDCILSVTPGDRLSVLVGSANGQSIGTASVRVLIDPFGVVFDSADGRPVSGTRITLIDAATGLPATVYGDDGVSIFPSTIVTGTTVTDSGGTQYNFSDGFYRFPFAEPGRYRIKVEPPNPYSYPSIASPAQIAALTRPDGGPFVVSGASYGAILTLEHPEPVRVDIPLDRPSAPLTIVKVASVASAAPGDVIQYRIIVRNPDALRATGAVTVTDTLPTAMKYRLGTMRYQGIEIVPTYRPDGRGFSVELPPLAGGGTGTLTYLAEVRPDARDGDAINRAQARDPAGVQSDVAESYVRVVRDTIADRFTIVGRVTTGGCTIDPRSAEPVALVRVMLEDGTYTVTDEDGRYHFEGLRPGTHVVQVDPQSFPLDQAPIDCAANTRSSGNPLSRFVEGRGGALKRADFRSAATAPRAAVGSTTAKDDDVASDAIAAGADRNWLADGGHGIAWLFPEADHNPRVRAIRVAIRHEAGQKVALTIGGKPVDPLAFDGQTKSADGSAAVSVWRGIPLTAGDNLLVARVTGADGSLVQTIDRTVHFSGAPVRAQFIPEKSRLIADGVTRPLIAVRLTDREGRPIQNGATGDFEVPSPYEPAVEIDALQANQLSGLERARPVWHVRGDDGVAYIELAPTTASGSVSIGFTFRDEDVVHTQRIDGWLDPGARAWTVVGFAAGTVGFNRLNEGLESVSPDSSDLHVDGRIALYAKGRVTGKWLLTLAYDSDKHEDETRFAGIIDPRAYYTIYADRAEQRYDAASVRKLYLKLERPQFFALFGDYQTGIDEPELARYSRALNGGKAEYRNRQLHAQAFAADTPFRHRREEIQGNGLSGPYALRSRDILANSEVVVIETRDRLRSSEIVDRRTMTRLIDYDIDYAAGTIVFREPILSRSSQLDPQFVVVDYDVDGVGQRVTNAGGRVSWTDKSEKVRVGATAIHDETDVERTNLVGVDVRVRPTTTTELRGEYAASDSQQRAGVGGDDRGTGHAWLVEAEHHGRAVDVIAYVREQTGDFGLGQLNLSESGTRKFGLDGRVRIAKGVSLAALAWQEDYLLSDARRRAVELEAEYRIGRTTARAGLTHADDLLSDGRHNVSTLARLGASQKFLNDRLELDAQTEFALGKQGSAGNDASIDFPTRHRFTARYGLNKAVRIVGGIEIAEGESINARTARIGFDLAPWAGGKIVASANRQQIAEYGARSYAAYGIAQSWRLSKQWSVDLSLDGNRTLDGFSAADVLNPLHPVATGGFIGNDATLTEDFIAVTAGATYRGERWSWANRAEYRSGDQSERYGLTSSILRQIGEGRAIGGQFTYFRAKTDLNGPATESATLEASWAHRPADSRWSLLDKVELRHDAITGAVLGAPGPIGGALLTLAGDAKSRRAVNSLSLNYAPVARQDRDGATSFVERGEYSLFWGTRYVSDRYGADDVAGWSNVVGADLKFDLGKSIDVGVAGTVRMGTGARTIAWSGGPAITVSPMKDANLTFGYNFAGFEDRDFEESRTTRSGAYVSFKLKFDQTSLKGLGL